MLQNFARDKINLAIEQSKKVLLSADENKRMLETAVDVTLPGRIREPSGLHPVSLTVARITKLFASLGYKKVSGPEIEDDWHNFEALNIPAHHPARAMHDTFYTENGNVLRTHTSPVQIRTLIKKAPPLRIIAPGRVYRCDHDLTHTPMFHQIEGLAHDAQS